MVAHPFHSAPHTPIPLREAPGQDPTPYPLPPYGKFTDTVFTLTVRVRIYTFTTGAVQRRNQPYHLTPQG